MSFRVYPRDGESVKQMVRRLRNLVERSGATRELRWHEYHVPPTQLRRKKQFKKRLKAREETLAEQTAGVQPVASLAEATAEFRRRTGKP